jgi:hypothetical protein
VTDHDAVPPGDDQRPIRLILDGSAIVAFTRESIHVGEVLAEVHDEQAVAALPLACLVEAVHAAADPDRLALLVAHRATVVIPDDPASWRALATTYDIVGRYDAATAALAASSTTLTCSPANPGCTPGSTTAAWSFPSRSDRGLPPADIEMAALLATLIRHADQNSDTTAAGRAAAFITDTLTPDRSR